MKTIQHVFSVVPDCHAKAGHYSTVWHNHFNEALRAVTRRLTLPQDLDFTWARAVGVDAGEIARERATTSERLGEQIRREHAAHGLDAVISCCFSVDVETELVKQTIQSGVPWINFYCDSTHRFPEVEALARVASLNWFPEHAAIERYAALGTPFFCRPYAYNPNFLPDLSGRAFHRKVGFIGVPTTNRITQLGWLLLFGSDVAIRGHRWVGEGANPFFNPIPARVRFWQALRQPGLFEKGIRRCFWPSVRKRAEGALGNNEFFDFIGNTQITLGLNQGRDERGRLLSYMKLRDLEFPGYGCCYLTEHNQDIAEALEVGREVLTCHSMIDAAAQIRELQDQPERARAIGRAGRQRVLASHTWAARLPELAARL